MSSSQIIQNKIYVVVGKPWKGKTFFATFLASFHRYIWANYEIKLNWKVCNNFIKKIDDLEKIIFKEQKQMIVIDEWGVNNNARRSSSDSNLLFGELAMLSRKKNANVIMISQLERMSDVYYRELAECCFEMNSWFVSSNKLMFEYSVERNWKIEGSKFVDLFHWSKLMWYEYNTLESGKIEIKQKGTDKVLDLLW